MPGCTGRSPARVSDPSRINRIRSQAGYGVGRSKRIGYVSHSSGAGVKSRRTPGDGCPRRIDSAMSPRNQRRRCCRRSAARGRWQACRLGFINYIIKVGCIKSRRGANRHMLKSSRNHREWNRVLIPVVGKHNSSHRNKGTGVGRRRKHPNYQARGGPGKGFFRAEPNLTAPIGQIAKHGRNNACANGGSRTKLPVIGRRIGRIGSCRHLKGRAVVDKPAVWKVVDNQVIKVLAVTTRQREASAKGCKRVGPGPDGVSCGSAERHYIKVVVRLRR